MKTAKTIALSALCLLSGADILSQTPNAINYQAVARDALGDVMMNQTIDVTFIVHTASAAGPVVFEEDHTGTATNQFGLFSLQIGQGVAVTGTFAGIDWSIDDHWLEVEVDGNSVGAQQLVAVPYALLARDVENDNVDDDDSDSTNELQTLSREVDTITLSHNGGSFVDNVNDADSSAINELQTLSVTGNFLTISNGNTVTLPTGGGGLTLPYINTVNDPLHGFDITNQGSGAGLRGANASNNSNVSGVLGEITSAGAGSTSAGVRGVNASSSGLGVGVWGLHQGSGWGVFGTTAANGVGVYGSSPGTGVLGESIGIGPGGMFSSVAGPALVTTTGNVGIGTSAPSAQLHIVGTMRYEHGSASTNYVLTSTDGLGNAVWTDPTTLLGSHNTLDEAYDEGGAGSGRVINADAGAVHVSGADGMHVDGRLGVGTTSPADIIHASGSSSGNQVRVASAGNGFAGFVANNTLREFFVGVQGVGDPVPGAFHIYDNTAAAQRFVIDAAGEVGIGVSSPSATLDVVGTLQYIDGTQGTNRVLRSDALGNASWVDPNTLVSDNTNTLDEAYDEGGAGSGRVIDASAGAVSIQGTDGFEVTGSAGGAPIGSPGSGRRMLFNPAKAAFRAGNVSGPQWDDVNVGMNSVAMGTNTIASGTSSSAFGDFTTATATWSTALGFGGSATGNVSLATGFATTASGAASTAFGDGSTASGDVSLSTGQGTEAESGFETVIGRFDTDYSPSSTTGWDLLDRLFVVGNGVPGSRSDAMVILKNGNTGIGTSLPSPTARLHVELDSNLTDGMLVTGAFQPATTVPDLGPGARMMFYPGKTAFRVGNVTGTAWDNANVGALSIALGEDVHAESGYEITLGRWNTDYAPGSTTGWNTSDRLFVLGNGTSSGARSDAIVVLKNGNSGFGESLPQRAVHISDVMRLEPRANAPSGPAAGDIYFDSTTNKLRVYDGSTWQDCW